MYQLSDVFIGNFGVTQRFGENPSVYKQFNLAGHNGVDFACPNGTQIVSAADGWVKEIGIDPKGYGNYIKIAHNGYLTIYAHLQQVVVHLQDRVLAGQLIGISDNTGFTTGAHLHFGVAPCDGQGNKTETNNGFSGYIDPMGPRCAWQVRDITAPVVPAPPAPAPGQNGDELRALAVLYDAFKALKLPDGSSFGNIEGLTRELVAAYPRYEELLKQPSGGA